MRDSDSELSYPERRVGRTVVDVDRNWNSVFARSSIGPSVFYIKGSRGRSGDRSTIDRIEQVLMSHDVPYQRGLIRGAFDAWRHAGFALLDGGYMSVTGGDGWGFGGGYVVGFDAFRLICHELGVVGPRKLSGEAGPVRSHAELLDTLQSQLADEEQRQHLELVAETLFRVNSAEEIRGVLSGDLIGRPIDTLGDMKIESNITASEGGPSD